MNGELHAPAALPVEKNRSTLWIGGWVGSRTSLKGLEKRDFFTSVGFRTTDHLAGSYTDYAIPAQAHEW